LAIGFGTNASVAGFTVDNISVRELPGNHATQATAAARPILRQTAGGLYYLEFDGVDDSYSVTEFSLPDGQSVFFAFEPTSNITSNSSSQVIIRDSDLSEGNTNYGLVSLGSTTFTLVDERFSWLTRTDVGSNQIAGRGYSGGDISAHPHLFTITFGNAADTTIFRIDGSPVATSETNQYGGFDEVYSSQKYNTIGSGTLNGKFFGLIMRGAETTGAELANTETYLAAKSGVTL
jgi:hypothetical protein